MNVVVLILLDPHWYPFLSRIWLRGWRLLKKANDKARRIVDGDIAARFKGTTQKEKSESDQETLKELVVLLLLEAWLDSFLNNCYKRCDDWLELGMRMGERTNEECREGRPEQNPGGSRGHIGTLWHSHFWLAYQFNPSEKMIFKLFYLC